MNRNKEAVSRIGSFMESFSAFQLTTFLNA